MKKILCYGDSNTYGYIPSSGLRYDKSIRWTGLLQKKLLSYIVIEEGACDRTGFVDNPKGYLYSAQKHFPVIMSNIKNIDILILSLGTNDLQFQYDITDEKIENGLLNLINIAQKSAEKIILIPPVKLNNSVLEGYFKIQFNQHSIQKSQSVGNIYQKISKDRNCLFFDINNFTLPSALDGLHYASDSHKLIAEKLADFIIKNDKRIILSEQALSNK